MDDSTPLSSLPLPQEILQRLQDPCVIKLAGGHHVLKPAWQTLGDLRNRRLGHKHPSEPESERCRGRLAFIVGISPQVESSIIEVIGTDLPPPETP